VTEKTGRDRLRIAAMIDAAEETRLDAAEGREAFLEKGKSQKAVLLDLIHLTESAEKTSPGLKRRNPDVPWDRLSRLRNRGLVHDYAEIDLQDVWSFVAKELPRIRRRLERINYGPAEV
jgi:uncharacterized protein with HEPN domain